MKIGGQVGESNKAPLRRLVIGAVGHLEYLPSSTLLVVWAYICSHAWARTTTHTVHTSSFLETHKSSKKHRNQNDGTSITLFHTITQYNSYTAHANAKKIKYLVVGARRSSRWRPVEMSDASIADAPYPTHGLL
jgi:hypothetical protein